MRSHPPDDQAPTDRTPRAQRTGAGYPATGEHTARQREPSVQARLDAANKRDAIAHARDLAALARERAADARDLVMAQLDVAAAERDASARALSAADTIVDAARQRERAAHHRIRSADHRALAAEDRQATALDREQAARDRLQALEDREVLARELTIAGTDPLTGARTRAVGLTDLDHEVDRCRRASGLLVVAYIDVVGPGNLDDTRGHGAGDELLKRVVALVRAHVRSYDLIIRLGGNRFLGAMSNMTMLDARKRFSAISAALAAGAIRTGFAQLTPDVNATELIARAQTAS